MNCLENPLLENREEQELANDIERDLNEVLWFAFFVLGVADTDPRKQLSECIDGMRHCSGRPSGVMSEHHQDVLIKRYQEIHFDYSSEFKNTSVIRSIHFCTCYNNCRHRLPWLEKGRAWSFLIHPRKCMLMIMTRPWLSF